MTPTPEDFPRIAPPADGLALAMATARSRRLRKASASSGASALALTMVAVLAGTSGRSTLTQQPTPEQPAVVIQVVPDGQKRTSDQQAKPNVVAPLTSSAGTSALGVRPKAGTSVVSGSTTPTVSFGGDQRRPGSSPGAAPRVTGPMKSQQQTTSPSDVACPVNKGTSGQDVVCPQAFTSAIYDDNNDVVGYQLESYICNYTTSSYALSYASDRELDVVIRDSKNKVVWRWSLEHPDQERPHTVRVPTGGCWSWETAWSIVDQQGRALPKGTYTLVSESYATQLAGQDPATYDINVD